MLNWYRRWRNRKATESGRTAYNANGSRAYATYAEYMAHQASKLDAHNDEYLTRWLDRVGKFQRRFKPMVKDIPLEGRVLCLGARLGEEVVAFRRLGLDAIGVDLNPGENNQYVEQGDFHALPYKDGQFKTVYSNVLDHVLDLDKFMKEAIRVCAPDGHIVLELTGGYEELGRIDPYGALIWPTNDALMGKLWLYLQDPIYEIDLTPSHWVRAWRRN